MSNVTEYRCISLDNKKPAKPYNLRVYVLLCTSQNLNLVREEDLKLHKYSI